VEIVRAKHGPSEKRKKLVAKAKEDVMGLRFDEEKATQVAGCFLALRGGRMHYLKLIKLLYLLDRTSLIERGIPITTDRYVSMDHGPVVSNIYNLMIEDDPRMKPIWGKYISPPLGDYEIELLVKDDLKPSRLSRTERRLIQRVFEEYGQRNRWDLRDYVLHRLPEWKNPHGSSIPITIADILHAGGETDETEVRAVENELDSIGSAESRLRRTA
jgi:uncharacterized phage-associated protein